MWHAPTTKPVVIFMTDNGGTVGVQIHNAGMRGAKATPYRGGTRVPAFWRWPAKFKGGVDINRLTAHVDIFPTFAEIAGQPVPKNQKLDGRSLLPLLADPNAAWADRTLFTHVGRWEKGHAAESKTNSCSVRNARYHLVNATNKGEKWELFDVEQDPGEKTNIIEQNPEMAKELRARLDAWWAEVLPEMVNENAIGPKENPFKERYWKQFGGGPAVK